MKKQVYLIALVLLVQLSNSQTIPVIVNGATIHTGTGQVIENGVVVIANGKILEAGPAQKALYKNARVIDARGKHLYPGLICMNSVAGLNEIDAVRATRDFTETGSINPNVRSVIAYNTDSKILPTLLFNGITQLQVVPQGGLISGTSSLMKSSGWNWEDALHYEDEGVHVNWPERNRFVRDEKQQERIDKMIKDLERFFEEAYRYCKLEVIEKTNIRFEAMRHVFTGQKRLYVHVNTAKGIATAVNFFKHTYAAAKIVLVGAEDSWQLTTLIKQYNIPVVLSVVHALPQRSHEDIDQPYKTAAMLNKEGILVAIGLRGSWESRNLAFNAGTAAAYGLGKEQALACITLNPARIMGCDSLTGSIEVGKEATIILSTGDVLDMRSNSIELCFLQGTELELNNQQRELYLKYLKKYGLE